MATFRVTGPDGGTYEVQAPDGASDADVFKMVSGHLGQGKEKPLAWSDVPGQALQNAPASAAKFGQAVAHTVMHPIDTVTNIADIAAGGVRAGAKRVLPEAVFNAIDRVDKPENTARIEGKASAFGDALNERYGGTEQLKKTLATDPVGAAADASLALTGGGALLTKAGMANTGQRVQSVARAIDPLTAAGRTVAGAGRFASEALGMTTGAGARPFREAYQAGKTGNQVFTDNMRGTRPVTDAVDMADQAVQQMGRERGAAYNANMAAVKANPTMVDLAPIRTAIQDAFDKTHYKGVVKDAEAQAIVGKMADKYNDFLNLPAAERTAEALDALKQAIGEIQKTTKQGTLSSTVAGSVYNATKAEITRQVPEYAAAMKDYANASDSIGEMRRTMSVNDRAAPDTTLRKLQSTMRNNVNTNYGQREKLLDTLAKHQPDLPAALAGQSLNTTMPRGLARISPAAIAASGVSGMNPATLAMLPLTSPRLMGEAAYGTGRTGYFFEQALRRAGVSPEMIVAMIRGAYAADAVGGDKGRR